MKALSLRGIDDELEKALQEKARESRNSLNGTILDILRGALGLSKRKYHGVHHDLDHLAGTWGKAALKEFEEATAVFGQVDEDLWR